MKILFVWTGVTSYMADCWRRLQQEQDVRLKVVVERVPSGKEFDADRVLHGLDYSLLDSEASQTIQTFLPDVVFAVGWHSKVVREIVTRKEWKDVPKVCCFDLPWRWLPRCIAARFVLWPFLRHYAAAYVPGKACAMYAKWLGFKRVCTGLFSIDEGRFLNTETRRRREGFLYVGRFAQEKRLAILLKAYARYRAFGGTWSLDLYGSGTLPDLSNLSTLSNHFHVHSFAQPDKIPGIYRSHACLVLTSAFDPWPLVALEAKAAGCEVIQSDRCGNRFELDTRVVKFGDEEALAREMLKVERGILTQRHGGAEDLKTWDCETWAKRSMELAQELCDPVLKHGR